MAASRRAGPQQLVDALSVAMTVSAVVVMAGALVGAVAIRAKGKTIPPVLAEADANPGGSEVVAREALP